MTFTKRALHKRTCDACKSEFMAKDVKTRWCEPCRHCADCGKLFKREEANAYGPGYCRKCQRKNHPSKAQIEQRERLWNGGVRARKNPMDDPAVRKAARDNMTKNHPSKAHPEQWREFAAGMLHKCRQNRSTKLELLLGEILGQGFVSQYRIGAYVADFADPKRKIVVEAQGCFWHSCPECFPAGPTSEVQRHNEENDQRKLAFLAGDDWRVLFVWEHEVRDAEGHEEIRVRCCPPPAESSGTL